MGSRLTVAHVVLTAASAVLFGLCFPTAGIRALGWIALVPFLAAVRSATTRGAIALSIVWTLVAAYAVGDWFPRAVASYYDQPLAVGVGMFLGVSLVMAAPYYAAFAVCYRAMSRRPGAAVPLLAAAAWVGAELGRGKLLTGNPWALFGYSQIGVDPLVQVADLTSVYGVSFLLVAVNAAVVELWAARAGARRRALGGAAVTALVVAAALGYGRWRLAALDARPPHVRPITVAMVQGNVDVGRQWREEFYGRNLDVYLRLTMDVTRERSPELIVWPENALTFFLDDEPRYRRAIARVLEPSGAQLVVGGPRFAGSDARRVFYNSVFLLAPDGEILGRYDKQKLLPLAEYFPVPALDLLRRRFARVRELTPGPPRPPLATRAGPAGVTICNEAMFPEIAAARVREGAVFLLDPANDTWLTPKFSAQQFDIVRLRTVEQRRYLVRASTAGPSAIVDPLGRVVVRTDFFTRAAIAGEVYPRTETTLYARIGDAFAYGCALVALGAWLSRSAGARRRRGSHRP